MTVPQADAEVRHGNLATWTMEQPQVAAQSSFGSDSGQKPKLPREPRSEHGMTCVLRNEGELVSLRLLLMVFDRTQAKIRSCCGSYDRRMTSPSFAAKAAWLA